VLKQSSRQKPDLLDERCRPLRNCARGDTPPLLPLLAAFVRSAPHVTSASLRDDNR